MGCFCSCFFCKHNFIKRHNVTKFYILFLYRKTPIIELQMKLMLNTWILLHLKHWYIFHHNSFNLIHRPKRINLIIKQLPGAAIDVKTPVRIGIDVVVDQYSRTKVLYLAKVRALLIKLPGDFCLLVWFFKLINWFVSHLQYFRILLQFI